MEILQSRSSPFDPEIVCRIFYQACRAVQHMHAQHVTHRDLKIENLLIGSDGSIKLCDFGSATTVMFQPDVSWSAGQRSMLEDNVREVFFFFLSNSS